MHKILLAVLFFLLLFSAAAFAETAGTATNLGSGLVSISSWSATDHVYALAYDYNFGVYLGGGPTVGGAGYDEEFAYYKPDLNSFTDKSSAIEALGVSYDGSIRVLGFDKNNLVFAGLNLGASVAKYSAKTSAATGLASELSAAGWQQVNAPPPFAFAYAEDGNMYIGAHPNNAYIEFARHAEDSNKTELLTRLIDFNQLNNGITSMVYDNNRNIYIGTSDGNFGKFSIDSNRFSNLTDRLFPFWGNKSVAALAADNNANIYLAGSGGRELASQGRRLARYIDDLNAFQDLNSLIAASWDNNAIAALAFDSNRTLYLGGQNGNLASLDIDSNAFTMLRSKIEPFWTTNYVHALAFDSNNYVLYLGGNNRNFARYHIRNPEMIASIANPSIDNNSYEPFMDFSVSASTLCKFADCNTTDTNLQYCVGAGCSAWYDLNSNSSSPLYLSTGSNTSTNSYLLLGASYPSNWTLKATQAGTFELRTRAKSVLTDSNSSLGTDRTISINNNGSGYFDINFFNPATDSESKTVNAGFDVNASVLCGINNCGNANIYIQYSVGSGTSNWYDVNSDSSSPLYISSGSNPVNKASMNAGQSQAANWVLVASMKTTFELRITATGSNANTARSPGTDKTIIVGCNGACFEFTASSSDINISDGIRKWVFQNDSNFWQPKKFYHSNVGSGATDMASEYYGLHWLVGSEQTTLNNANVFLDENLLVRKKIFAVSGTNKLVWTIYPTGKIFGAYTITTNISADLIDFAVYYPSCTGPQLDIVDPTATRSWVVSDTTSNNFAGLEFLPFTSSSFVPLTNTFPDCTGSTSYYSRYNTGMQTGQHNMLLDSSHYRATRTTWLQDRNDFRNPAVPYMNTGSLVSDGFDENTGAYSLQASSNIVDFNFSALDFNRFKPAFEITNYTSGTQPVVKKNNIVLSSNRDYVSDTNSDSNLLVVVYLNDLVDTNSHWKIYLDTNAPVTSSDANSSWQKTDANVFLSCTDAASGCSSTKYRVDSNSASDVNYGSWAAYDSNVFFAADGNFALDFNSTDVSGNIEARHTVYILIDKTLPSASITSPASGSSTTSTSISLVYTGSDAMSGIQNYWVKADSDDWIDNNASTSYTFSSQGIGTHTYYVKAQDLADNNSTAASTTIVITSPPSSPSAGGTPSTDTGSGGGGGGGGSLCPAGKYLSGGKCLDKLEFGSSCSSNIQCVSSNCVNGACIDCLDNDDCASDRYCSNTRCAGIQPGQCGYIQDHNFSAYECCSNADCGFRQACDLNLHDCRLETGPKLFIVIDPREPAEGDIFNINVFGENIGLVEDVVISIDGGAPKTISKTFSVSLIGGTHAITATKQGFVSDRLEVFVLKKIIIKAPSQVVMGEPVEILVTDLAENPLEGVELLIILENGETRVVRTNIAGIAFIQSEFEGSIMVEAKSSGYSSASAQVSIVPPTGGEFVIPAYVLTVLAITFFLVAFVLRKRLKASMGVALQKRLEEQRVHLKEQENALLKRIEELGSERAKLALEAGTLRGETAEVGQQREELAKEILSLKDIVKEQRKKLLGVKQKERDLTERRQRAGLGLDESREEIVEEILQEVKKETLKRVKSLDKKEKKAKEEPEIGEKESKEIEEPEIGEKESKEIEEQEKKEKESKELEEPKIEEKKPAEEKAEKESVEAQRKKEMEDLLKAIQKGAEKKATAKKEGKIEGLVQEELEAEKELSGEPGEKEQKKPQKKQKQKKPSSQG